MKNMNEPRTEYLDTIKLSNGDIIKRYKHYFSGKMEITESLIETIYKRVEQVFIAKMNHKPDRITLDEGYFTGSYSYGVAYGGQETESCSIYPNELTMDLDDIVKKREKREKLAKEEQDRTNKIRWAKDDERKKRERKANFEKLKKEFGS